MRRWLKDIRNKRGLYQVDVANKIGISRQFYTMIETGSRNPSVKVAKKIASLFGFEDKWYILLER